MSLFVKWSCGCIGFHTEDQEKATIIEPCDSGSIDDHPLHIGKRDMSRSAFEEVPLIHEVELLTELGQLIADGYRLRDIKFLLK